MLVRLCAYLTVAVHTDVFVYLEAPEVVFRDAFANCRINLLNRSPSATYHCGAVGVVLILYLRNSAVRVKVRKRQS